MTTSKSNEKYVKRECGCEIELIHRADRYDLYLRVCGAHMADWQFRVKVNELCAKFDAGLQDPEPGSVFATVPL